MIVLDYSAARLTGDAILGYKARGAIRYAGLPETNIKIINKAEADSIRAAGLSVALVFEQYTTDAYGGYSAGVANATKLKNHALALGLPARGFLAQDEWIRAGQRDNVYAYFQGAVSVLGANNVGAYGFNDTMDLTKSLNLGAYWQCGDQTTLRPFASVYQRNYGKYSVSGIDVDVNDIIASDWLQSPQTQQSTIEVNDMQIVQCDELGVTGVLDGGRLRGIDGATNAANPSSLFPRLYVTATVWNDWVKESGKIDDLDKNFAALSAKLDGLVAAVKAVGETQTHAVGALSVSGTLNVQ